ncbi:DedA family protein [Sulfurovum sp. ST-21]|uniref:DedA family protein n=1 Tax=Sulfurovum indicum TaxID=2779528 RepID=A0A7M1S1D1_9BACT|nr:DedA family protein [Sulfurovum indicum]QOR61198.1 DedA family protein [Sulfurovum indicum]
MDFSSLETWGYLAVAFFSFGGSFFIVAAAGVFSYMGHMDLAMALTVAAIANFMGDNFLFYLGKYQKKEIQPYFAKHKRKLALATLIMRKYGVAAIFIQKFIYGVKTLVPLSMALAKYDFKKFVFFNIFASVIFVLTIGLSAYFASETIIALFGVIKEKPWIAPLVLFSIIGAVWFGMEKMTKKR